MHMKITSIIIMHSQFNFEPLIIMVILVLRDPSFIEGISFIQRILCWDRLTQVSIKFIERCSLEGVDGSTYIRTVLLGVNSLVTYSVLELKYRDPHCYS